MRNKSGNVLPTKMFTFSRWMASHQTRRGWIAYGRILNRYWRLARTRTADGLGRPNLEITEWSWQHWRAPNDHESQEWVRRHANAIAALLDKCDGLCKFKSYDAMCGMCQSKDSRHHDNHTDAEYPYDCRSCAAEWRTNG